MKIKSAKLQDNKTTCRDVSNSSDMQYLTYKGEINSVFTKIGLSFLFLFLLISCSPQKKLAYDFVKQTKGTSVAFYVPEELKKMNMRKDCDPNNVDLVVLDECQLRDTIEARTKIINKIDDKIFLDVMIASFEEALKDYGLSLEYWEKEHAKPDSLHWIVDLSHLEIQENVKHKLTDCGVYGNYEFLKITAVGVASWFELINGDESSDILFTEQDYEDYLLDCYYTLDSLDNLIVNAEFQYVDIDGFYDFAVMLGKLYAGYSFDYFMNEYVRKEMKLKGKDYSDEIYMRYDPYESYIYYTRGDKLIKIEN